MTEADMGILWATMAAKEGHRKGFPAGLKAACEHPRQAEIRRLQAEGKTRLEIARIVGLTPARISQIAPLT